MSFKRYVELGRVCLINYGDEAGKLATIVDVIDNNRVLVDGPETGVKRQQINLKRIQLTDIKIPAKLNCSQKYAPPQLFSSTHAFAVAPAVGPAAPIPTPEAVHDDAER
jgi:hypothetical protein